MAGRHWAGRPAWQVIAAARPPRPIPIADARSLVAHPVDDDVAQHRHSGRYLAVCGARVLAASRSAPDRGRCRECVIEVVSR